MRLAGSLGRRLKPRARPKPDVLDGTVSDDDVRAHLAALHEAGLLTDEELRRKTASLGVAD